MRYIAYRAKGHDGKWWVGTNQGELDSRKRIVNLASFFMHLYSLDLDPKTLGQYIGVKGADGKHLFAGDIIQSNGIKYVIEYCNASLMWWAWDYKAWWEGFYDAYEPLKDMDSIIPEACTPPCVPELRFNSLKCIGNIYDNPDNILICSGCEYLNKCNDDPQKWDYCPLVKGRGKYWHGVMPA